ncbi:MAG: traG [Rhodoferax sp.]|nr:traG [Rhodoferax sp.]
MNYLRWSILVVFAIACFTVVASWVLVCGLHLQSAYPGVWRWQWWLYLVVAPADASPAETALIAKWLGYGAAIGALFGLAPMVAFAIKQGRPRLRKLVGTMTAPEPERANSRVHDDARWMTMDEAQQVFVGPGRWGGIPVAEAYRPDQDRTAKAFDEDEAKTWGMGGKAPLLQTPLTHGATLGIIIGGSGSFKTVGFTLPCCAAWRGSIVVLDPSSQVGPMVTDMREGMGHTVALVDYKHPERGSFNVLDCLDLYTAAPEVQIAEFVDWAFASTKGTDAKQDPFFVPAAKEMACTILADLLADNTVPANRRNVREWRQRMTIPEPEMRRQLENIFAESRSSYAREMAGTMMRTPDKTFGSIYKVMTTETKWLSIPAFADLLSGSTFNPRDLRDGNLTVIIQADDTMRSAPAMGRVIVGSLARVVSRAKGETASPVPFILDEMHSLGHMQILAEMRDQGRKMGVHLFPMWQSIGQIEETWGKEGKKSWYSSAAWRMYAMVNDAETAKEVSERCGTYTALTRTEGQSVSRQGMMGRNTRGTNDNVSTARVDLISPYQVQTAMRPDEAIIIPRTGRALRCGRPLWFRRPEMRARILPDVMRKGAA